MWGTSTNDAYICDFTIIQFFCRDNYWHMDYWLDTNCCSNNNAAFWLWTLHQQNLSNDGYGIVQDLFSAELWDLWNEVK